MARNAPMCNSSSASEFMQLTLPQIQFFAHLTVAGLISPESMISLLQSFVAVLDEFGVSHGRAKKAASAAGEGLIIVSQYCDTDILLLSSHSGRIGP